MNPNTKIKVFKENPNTKIKVEERNQKLIPSPHLEKLETVKAYGAL